MPLSTRNLLKPHPLIPVITIADAQLAVPLAETLVAGGLHIIEITLRTDEALKAIELIAKHVPQITLGAGTVCTKEQLQQVHDAGASFAISPALLPELVQQADALKLPYIPGVTTPSEVMLAQSLGLDVVKFFPAAYSGGIPMLEQFHTVFPDMLFCPTGGIDAESAEDYLALPNVISIGGSWITPKKQLAEANWQAIDSTIQHSLSRLARLGQMLS